MTTIIKRNLFYLNCLNDLQKHVIELFNVNQYKKIYVSIGSKWNEYTYEYNQIYGNKIYRETNSHLQLVPNFMKKRNEKVILIALDQFHDVENRMENFKVVQDQLSSNMDFIFYDNIDAIDVIQTFVQFIIEIIEMNNISPDDFMIVNYICFQRPNNHEYFTEKNSKNLIYNLLKNTIYIDCYYQWFGYQENLYNIVYRYNKYNNMYRFNEILCALHTLLRSNLFGVDNVYYIYDYYTTQKHNLYFTVFLNNVVDISSFYINETKICNSLMENLQK
jgi:hypothetical protein